MKPTRPAGPRLGELLETRGHLPREVLLETLRHQRATGGRIGTCLLELEKITEDDLLHVLSDQLKVPFTAPEDFRSLPEEIVKLVPEKVARQRYSIPIRTSSTHLSVAMRDPTDLLALDELSFVTGKRIRAQVASEIRILEALAKYYGVELASRFVKLLDRLNRERFLWTKSGTEEAQPPGIVDLPLFVVPSRVSDSRFPAAPSASASAPILGSPPAVAAAENHPSADILAPIVTVFAPATDVAAPVSGPVSPPAVANSSPLAASPPAALPAAPVAPPPPPAPPSASVATAPAGPTPVLGGSPAESAPTSASLLSIEAAEAQLRDPSGRDEIGRLLIEFARGRAASALLLMVRRDEAAGWLGFGPGLDDESVEACKVELNAPSFVRALRDGASMHRGALAEMPAHAEIRSMLSTNWATDLIALPLRIRERLVGVMVMTLEEGVFSPGSVEELTRLVATASVALELLVLRQKLHG